MEDIPNWESLEELKSNGSSSLSMILSQSGSGEQWSGTLLVLVVEVTELIDCLCDTVCVLCSISSSPVVGAVVLKSLLESEASKDLEVSCESFGGFREDSCLNLVLELGMTPFTTSCVSSALVCRCVVVTWSAAVFSVRGGRTGGGGGPDGA